MSTQNHTPHIDALRVQLQAKGVTSMHVSWAPGAAKLTADERARELLAIQWEIDQGHSTKRETFERPWGWRWDLRTMKRSFRIDWRFVRPWLRDELRAALTRVRRRWNLKVRRLHNPYRGGLDAAR